MSARVEKKSSPVKSKKQLKGIVLTPQQKKRQRERSIAIALSLSVLVILFFAVTMVKGPAVLTRPI
jgi:hypothetical protein